MIGFNNITDNLIDINSFNLKWRFTDPKYTNLPTEHLNQLKPLNKKASKFLWDYIINTKIHSDIPFKKDFFKTIDKAKISLGNEKIIKKWLYKRGFPFEKEVYLSWQPDTAMIVPWKLFVKYFDSFYYSTSDDLSIIDESLNWALLFYHEDEIYFGTNEKFESSNEFKNVKFTW